MRQLRTIHDIRGGGSRSARPGPLTEPAAYATLTQLARERQRLLSQQESSRLRLGRISKRLAEIDGQVQRLSSQLPQIADKAGRPRRRRPVTEIEFRY